MTPRPADVALLEELADELERWSAFAQGAFDDTQARHRHVQERVRRTERAGALVHDALLADQDRLGAVELTLERLAGECDQLVADLDAHEHRLTAALDRAKTMRLALDAAERSNRAAQERVAAKMSTAIRDDQKARMALHRALDDLRTDSRRAFRRGRKDAETAFRTVEQDAHRAAAALIAEKAELSRLQAMNTKLVDGIAELELDAERARLAIAQLDEGRRAAALGRERVVAARAARDEARARVALCATADRSLDLSLTECRARFDVAEHHARAAATTYESVQRLTITMSHQLRDELNGEPPTGPETAPLTKRAAPA